MELAVENGGGNPVSLPIEAARVPRRLPREARDGLMRVWLELLREQHPGVTWIPVDSNTEAAR